MVKDIPTEATPKPSKEPGGRVPSFQDLTAVWSSYKANAKEYQEALEKKKLKVGGDKPESPAQRSILGNSRRLRHRRKKRASMEGGFSASSRSVKRLRRQSWSVGQLEQP